MTKSFRPEGWENPYPQEGEEVGTYWTELVFEAGADAMLKALREMGEHGSVIVNGNQAQIIVIIPDDEE